MKYYPDICMRRLRKITKTSVVIVFGPIKRRPQIEVVLEKSVLSRIFASQEGK
jgi:hypothetical protein